MAPLPLKLTGEQLDQVMRTAGPVPVELRDEYLRRVADQLQGNEFGDGEVYRACRAAAKAIMYSVLRAIDERPQPKVGEANKLLTAPTRGGRPFDPRAEERAYPRGGALERRLLFDRLHAEAGKRLRALRAVEPQTTR